MNDDQMEQLLSSKLVDFKKLLAELNEKVLSDLYCDVLPYVLSDSQFNMVRIIDGCLEKIIKGDFNVTIDQYNNYVITVTDHNGFDHRLQERIDTSHGTLVKRIFEANETAVRDAYVTQLEEKVEHLKQRLNEAYGLR